MACDWWCGDVCWHFRVFFFFHFRSFFSISWLWCLKCWSICCCFFVCFFIQDVSDYDWSLYPPSARLVLWSCFVLPLVERRETKLNLVQTSQVVVHRFSLRPGDYAWVLVRKGRTVFYGVKQQGILSVQPMDCYKEDIPLSSVTLQINNVSGILRKKMVSQRTWSHKEHHHWDFE